jgi:hypothetical protein
MVNDSGREEGKNAYAAGVIGRLRPEKTIIPRCGDKRNWNLY